MVPGLDPGPGDEMPGGLEILPDLVEPADREGDRGGDAQRRRQRDRPPEDPFGGQGTSTVSTAMGAVSGQSSV